MSAIIPQEEEDFTDDASVDDLIPTFESEEWLKKRKQITYVAYLYCLLHGAEYSVVVLSLYYYLVELKIKHIVLYYSLAMGGMAMSATITAFVFGYLYEKRISFRKILLIVVTLSVIGNLFYSLHFSVWLVILGRVLCGIGEAICTTAAAEFKRLYSNDEREVVLYRLEVIYITGFLFGPILCLITHSMNLTMGAWTISSYNAFTIFLIISFSFCVFAIYVGVEDIPDEPIEELAMLPERTTIRRKNSERSSLELSSKITRAKMLNRLNIGLICYSSAMLNYVAVITELTLPIIAGTLFKWSFVQLSVVMLFSISFFFILYFILNKQLPSGIDSIYNLFIVCLLLLSLSLSLLLLIFNATGESSLIQSVLVFIVSVINSCGGLTAIRLANLLFTHTIPSPDKTFHRILGLIGYCTACIIIPFMNIIIPLIMIMLTIASILLLVQKRYFDEVVNLNKGSALLERNIEQQQSEGQEESPRLRRKEEALRLGMVRMNSVNGK